MNTQFELDKKKTIQAIQKKLSSFETAIKQAKSEYESTKEFEHVKHLAELVKADISQAKEELREHGAHVEKQLSEMVEDIFDKSKKLEKALSPITAILKQFDKDVHYWLEALKKAQEASDADSLQALQKSLKLFETQEPYHLYHSESGHEIFVGKNADGNEVVTFTVAHDHDLWLHAHSVNGAHVVIRKKRGQEVDPETIQDAVQLALHYSKAKGSSTSVDILVTEKDQVSNIPKTPKDKVVVGKHKTISATYDLERAMKLIHQNENDTQHP